MQVHLKSARQIVSINIVVDRAATRDRRGVVDRFRGMLVSSGCWYMFFILFIFVHEIVNVKSSTSLLRVDRCSTPMIWMVVRDTAIDLLCCQQCYLAVQGYLCTVFIFLGVHALQIGIEMIRRCHLRARTDQYSAQASSGGHGADARRAGGGGHGQMKKKKKTPVHHAARAASW